MLRQIISDTDYLAIRSDSDLSFVLQLMMRRVHVKVNEQ